MRIIGEDEAGVEWEGDVDLHVEDGEVAGTIDWSSSSGRSGTETVRGTLDDDGTLEMWGISVDSDDIVPCRYRGMWIGNDFDVDWVGHCPGGHASSEDEENGDGDGSSGGE